MARRESMQRARAALLADLDRMLRKVNAQAVLLSQAVAGKAGLNSTDLECLDLLNLEGAMTPGRLAAATGLTTGAITAVINRLERAGYVRRSPNGEDARSIIVEIEPDAVQRLAPLYEPLVRSMKAMHDRYSHEQLSAVLDYLTQAHEAGAAHLGWLKVAAPAVQVKGGRRNELSRAGHRKRG